MTDTCGREIYYLRLSVTERCNLRCRYCMPAEGIPCKRKHEEMLTEEEMIQAVEVAAGLGFTKLRVTGGEPLVKKNILSICEKAARVPGIQEVCLTTNGILLPRLAKPLAEAGVRRISLSLDTLDPEKYTYITRTGTLRAALDGLEAALSAGFRKVKINTVLIGGFNDDEVRPLAELTRKYPVDVRFIELMPMVEGAFGPDAFVSNQTVLDQLPELVPDRDDGVARMYRLSDALGSVGLISAVSAHFCGQCNRVRLTADGRLKPCLHSPDEYPIKGLDRGGVRAQLERAILGKPRRHGELSADSPSGAGRAMNRIGG